MPRIHAVRTNMAHLNGRNLLYSPDGGYQVSIPYLTADMVDKTPEDPLDVFAFGTYNVKVQAARIELAQPDLDKAIAAFTATQQAVTGVTAQLLAGNRVAVGGTFHPKGLPIGVPFSARAKASVTGPNGLRVDPESVKVFGLPVRWALRFIDPAKYVPGGLVRKGPGGSLAVDTSHVPGFEGSLSGLEIGEGKLALRIGAQPDAPVSRARRLDDPNYCELTTTGEVTLDAGIIRDAKVVILDDTPQDPYSLNKWNKEGYARLERGQVVLPLDRLRQRFSNVGGGFTVKQVDLAGTDLVVHGAKVILGVGIPVSFKLRFAPNANGKLKLTPYDVHVAGINFGQKQVVDAMLTMPGMKRDGDGVLLDMRATDQVEMPPIKGVTGEPGRIVLTA